MTDHAYTRLFFRKLSLVCAFVGIITTLAVLSINLATNRYNSPGEFGKNIGHNVVGIGHSLAAITRLPGDAVHAVGSTLNVKAFIQPADALAVQTIAPAPAHTVAAVLPTPAITTAAVVKPLLPSVNTYAWGNCTWWAAQRRIQAGDPIPTSWGNAANWAARARRDGYVVDHQPTPGAIMQTPYSAGGLGHVAFVESIDPDGTWHISEMNVVGLNVVDHAAEPASAASSYNFIHDRL